MRISYNWLKEYVEVKMAPEALADLLTMSGLTVESVERRGDDHLIEIEVTSNRSDLLSVIGVAREVAALTGRRLAMPRRDAGVATRGSTHKAYSVKISVEDEVLCARYTGRVIEDVRVKESPAWLRARMEAMGLRPVNNVVDVTNFVLFEMGEPMHAFDLDKIPGGEVVVRRARKGEKITAIDGVERGLDDTMLVIADKERPIAIAGIMGGLNTEVTSSTRRVLLEAAIFDPVSIRKTGRRLGLSSESSYRFERRIDPEVVAKASERASQLIAEVASGKPGLVIDKGKRTYRRSPIALRYGRLGDTLGIALAPSVITKTLVSLGCATTGSSKEGITVQAPSFRQDLEREIDLIEEVARVYGYDKIPLTVPALPEDRTPPLPRRIVVAQRAREVLAGLGLDEIATYSLLSRRECMGVRVVGEDQMVASPSHLTGALAEIENPLSAEQEVMRPSLVPGLLKTIAWNINRKATRLGFFELGAVYLKKPSQGFLETWCLAVGISGQSLQSWKAPSRALDFFDLKGIIEALAAELRLEGIAVSRGAHPLFAKASSSIISLGERPIGFLGEVAREALAVYDIKQKTYVLELSFEALERPFVPCERYREIPRYPSVTRDLSIVVEAHIECAQVERIIREKGGALVKGIDVIDRYIGKQIPDGKIGLTYRIEYRDVGKTLEDAHVNEVQAAIFSALEGALGARLR